MNIVFNPTLFKKLKTQQENHQKILAIRLSASGCSGWAYNLEFIPDARQEDTLFEINSLRLAVSKKDAPFMEGLKVEAVKNGLQETVVFESPLATQSCGCGQSLYFGKEMS